MFLSVKKQKQEKFYNKVKFAFDQQETILDPLNNLVHGRTPGSVIVGTWEPVGQCQQSNLPFFYFR
jgi:hypothetical protein